MSLDVIEATFECKIYGNVEVNLPARGVETKNCCSTLEITRKRIQAIADEVHRSNCCKTPTHSTVCWNNSSWMFANYSLHFHMLHLENRSIVFALFQRFHHQFIIIHALQLHKWICKCLQWKQNNFSNKHCWNRRHCCSFMGKIKHL